MYTYIFILRSASKVKFFTIFLSYLVLIADNLFFSLLKLNPSLKCNKIM